MYPFLVYLKYLLLHIDNNLACNHTQSWKIQDMKLKTIISSFSLITILTVLAGLFLYFNSIKTAAINEGKIVSETNISSISRSFSQLISRYNKITLTLSRHEDIASCLKEDSENNRIRSNQILDLFNTSLETSVCYLLNKNGIAIASSNRNESDSFIGNDYSFRPYFKASMKDNSSVYLAHGVTSNRRGIYFSAPVYASDSGSIMGVVVIKDAVDKIENDLLIVDASSIAQDNIIIISNKDGVIFLSNRKDLLFNTIWQVDENRIRQVAGSKQFGKGPWPWAGFKRTTKENAMDRSNCNYHLLWRPIHDLPGWKIILLNNSDIISKKIHTTVFKAAGYIFTLIFIIIGFVLVVLNFLAIKAEKSLKESETRFKALHNASFGGISIHEKGVILDCNKGLSEMTGYSVAELIGMNGLLLIAEKSRNAVMENIVSGYEKAYEATGLRKNGKEFPMRLEARNIPYKGKNVRAVEFRDITEPKRAAEEQEQLKAQLIQAQKMESVGRLAGGVAHDFNNMLSIILGNTEMILEDLDSTNPAIDNLNEIYNAAQRSSNLTRQLLAFARKQTISPKVLDLNETIEGMLRILRRLIGENIDLAWLPNPNLWTIKFDPSQLDQILANLCVNARDSITDVGKVTIETDNVIFDKNYCREHDGFKPGNYVMTAVSDNGCGMDKKILDNLFEPFFTTKDFGEGTGLGLATVYGIVKQNNGFIKIYSEPDKGTTFKIYLLRHENDLPEQRSDSKKIDSRGCETILLVEDEAAILKITTMMLERLGYKVLSASNPNEAINMGKSLKKIDLLMTDVVMPMMNGRDLSKKMQHIFPTLKCLFMSGYTANVIAHHGVLDDGMQFIQKPFSRQALAKKVRDILDEKTKPVCE
jgi:PAS domain S-box-containing protein